MDFVSDYKLNSFLQIKLIRSNTLSALKTGYVKAVFNLNENEEK